MSMSIRSSKKEGQGVVNATTIFVRVALEENILAYTKKLDKNNSFLQITLVMKSVKLKNVYSVLQLQKY